MQLEKLIGIDESDLVEMRLDDHSVKLHKDLVSPLESLTELAKSNGIALKVASAYRDHGRQLAIWNGKFNQQRPVYDRRGNLVDLASLSEWQKVKAILEFSAIPGTSRHHWGCDLDVFDGAAIGPDYRLQLAPIEYSETGPFAKLQSWMTEHLEAHNFFRPYLNQAADHIGVSFEPWHISYKPIAETFQGYLSNNKDALQAFISESDILGKDAICEHFDFIFQHYIFCEKTI